ncbi:MAG: leucine-rich repeat domain-containing protein [Candidatus Kariarchaeaceae archaeon]|jgi:Leucine-rich repeat (LRR) protein
MSEKELLIDFLMDVNRLNLSADPDLHYTIYYLKDEKFMVQKDIELRSGDPQWKQKPAYSYSNNYTFEGDNLTELYLGKMNLSFIPDSISLLTHLQKFYAANNVLTYLPESIGNLSHLKHLNLSNNQLSQIPDSIGRIEGIESLNFAQNNLQTLPDIFGNFRHLQEIDLSDNKLRNIPKSLFNLPKQVKSKIHMNSLPESDESRTNVN